MRALSLAIARAHAGRNWAGNINYFLFDRIYWNIKVCINCDNLKINYTVGCNILSNKKNSFHPINGTKADNFCGTTQIDV